MQDLAYSILFSRFERSDGSIRTFTTSSDSSMRVRNVVYNIALHHACLSVILVSVCLFTDPSAADE